MYRKHSFFRALWRHAVLLFFVVFALFPILWVISASFNPANTLVGQTDSLNPSLDNYGKSSPVSSIPSLCGSRTRW